MNHLIDSCCCFVNTYLDDRLVVDAAVAVAAAGALNAGIGIAKNC